MTQEGSFSVHVFPSSCAFYVTDCQSSCVLVFLEITCAEKEGGPTQETDNLEGTSQKGTFSERTAHRCMGFMRETRTPVQNQILCCLPTRSHLQDPCGPPSTVGQNQNPTNANRHCTTPHHARSPYHASSRHTSSHVTTPWHALPHRIPPSHGVRHPPSHNIPFITPADALTHLTAA